MLERKLGNTGLDVGEVGMGCNRLGEDSHPTSHWVDLVRRAVDLGVNLFDTSERYGKGRSEEILGEALAGRSGILIAGKVRGDSEGVERDFSAATVIERAERSLKRLRRDCIDIYQLHSPDRRQLEEDGWAEGMERLREQGKIRFPAVAIGPASDGLYLIEQGYARVLQVTYNIFQTEPEERLLAAAEAAGVAVLVRMPLARGVLSGKFAPGAGIPRGHRARLDGEKALRNVEWSEDLRPLAAGYPGGMARMAHHFALAPTAVSAIIPGARTVEQLEANAAASDGTRLPAETRRRIEALRPRRQ